MPRFYPVRRPQKASLPCIEYQVVSDPPDMAHDGPSGLVTTRVQLRIIAPSYADLERADRAVQVRNGFKGVFSSTDFDAVIFEGGRDGYDSAAEEFSAAFYRNLDFIIWHREATAQ